jgi:prepilin signal peptidase PulO-like enzyme (type II secretory pathway)
MVGAWLGWKMVILTFVLSSMMGGLVGVVLLASRRADMATRVPFGTMLAVAAMIASLYGGPILAWYLSRF